MSKSPRDYATDYGIAIHAMDADTLWAQEWIKCGCLLDTGIGNRMVSQDEPITKAEYEALVEERRRKARQLRARKRMDIQ